jgi:hypothetical protein
MKKSQLQNIETIAVIIAIVFISVLVYGAYSKYSKIKIKNEISEIQDKEIVKKAIKIYNLPELQYTEKSIKQNCIDLEKLFLVKDIIDNSENNPLEYLYFREILGDSKINIVQIYPLEGKSEEGDIPLEIEFYDKKPNEFDTSYSINLFVNLCNATTKEKKLGYIKYTSYKN